MPQVQVPQAHPELQVQLDLMEPLVQQVMQVLQVSRVLLVPLVMQVLQAYREL